MDQTVKKRRHSRINRVRRVRKKLKGTAEKPRLSVSKTNMHLYAQLINDETGVTLGGIGTLSKINQSEKRLSKSKEGARTIGQQIAELAKEKKIESVVFDRGRNKYHGLIALLAEEARKAGLQF